MRKGSVHYRWILLYFGIATGLHFEVGLEEVTAVYENVNAESVEELEQGGASLMEKAHQDPSGCI